MAGGDSAWFVFIGGAIAVCAWVLPAVSGSYMLLVMGLYETVLNAINTLDFQLLLTLAAGCVTGLMLFVRLLSWLLRHHAEPLLCFLTGFMLGSMVNLWPWRIELAGLEGLQWVWPWQYTAVTGVSSQWVGCLVSVVCGALMLWQLSRLRPVA